jgi:hypothetical protein
LCCDQKNNTKKLLSKYSVCIEVLEVEKTARKPQYATSNQNDLICNSIIPDKMKKYSKTAKTRFYSSSLGTSKVIKITQFVKK